MAGLAMKQEDVIRMAYEAGIIPWCQMHWSANQFVTIDEGMDGDLTCLMQFAALIAAAERKAIWDMLFEYAGRDDLSDSDQSLLKHLADLIRARSNP